MGLPPIGTRQRYANLGLNEPRDFPTDWIWPTLGLFITTAIGIAITVLKGQHWRSSEDTAMFVLEQRPTIAIVVQIISHILGGVQIQTLCGVIMSSFRVMIHHRAFQLDTIRFIDAVSRPNIAWGAHWTLRLGSLLFVLIALIPGAIWSGALTPLFAEKVATRTIHIPTFKSENVTTIFDAQSSTKDMTGGFGSPVWMNSNGLFTFDLAIFSVRAPFLGLASSSANTSQPGGFSKKFDQTGYSFAQRSYGVGASAGLIQVPEARNPQWYSYQETGLYSSASCKRNDSSQLNIKFLPASDQDAFFNYFQANGTFPNGAPVQAWYPQIAPQRQDIFIWTTQYVREEKKTYVMMTVDSNQTDVDEWDFNQFLNVQCVVDHQPRKFTVMVNETSKEIMTNSTSEDAVPWPAYGHKVLSTFNTPLQRYSADESMIFGSQLGHALVLNINQLRLVKGNNDTETTYEALQYFIESLFDNGLGMLSATRLIALNKTIPVEATVGLVAVKYGEASFIYIILAVNMVIALIFAIEAVRTRGWHAKAELQFQDVGSLMLSASAGGVALAEKARDMHEKDLGKTEIRLCTKTFAEREALVLKERTMRLDEREADYQEFRLEARKSVVG
ncbi:hypothetical protein P280DRAFT_504949 [Massarina eburnea CBS 473.64]|uniref:Uncharacterized protein n=1 Tax=Massarina eburnea CBS 473.64 TaxID=1395130 RepID=A0A6A6S8I9_9PLEO|nr:hypothetical protein P280DRAFT_504949 [Massarina eburnea CBS 473.64]